MSSAEFEERVGLLNKEQKGGQQLWATFGVISQWVAFHCVSV